MPWWHRLDVRLAATVVLAAALVMAVFSWLVLHAQESFLLGRVTFGAGLLSDTIKNSTYHAMLEDRRSHAYQAMEDIGRQPGIDHVRFFNKEGRITFSTIPAERGGLVDKRAEACYACHAADQPIERLNVPSRSRVYRRGTERVLGVVTPIYNEPNCSSAACHAHPPDRTVLGVLDIGISLGPVDASLHALRWQTLSIAGLAVVGLAGMVTWFAHRAVVRPVEELRAAAWRIAAGDLGVRLRIRSSTELGELEQAFNDMGAALSITRNERDELLASLERKVEERTAALKQAQQQLVRSEKLSSLGRLAASVAHEINNPLAGILTYAKLLLRTLTPEADRDPQKALAVKHLTLVQRETERCSAIVRNLLDFARERPMSLAEIPLAAVVDEALVLVNNQAKLQNVEIVRDINGRTKVYGDFGQLRQACINVIINACDAMKNGGTLRIASREDESGVTLSFSDTGTGIAPEHLAKVLDPFFTTKEKGTGLGLSVVYGILERHGGSVDLTSTPGDGTTVTFRFPLASRAQALLHRGEANGPTSPYDLGTGAARTGGHAG